MIRGRKASRKVITDSEQVVKSDSHEEALGRGTARTHPEVPSFPRLYCVTSATVPAFVFKKKKGAQSSEKGVKTVARLGKKEKRRELSWGEEGVYMPSGLSQSG